MTIFKHLFWAAMYSVISLNGIIMTAQYFLGINSIIARVLGAFEEMNIAALL
ncbi:MAG: hypothetical protein JNK43_05570 [Ignavibacteria bacterium]|nr:hypothetical protein [Ignavibacteria bacterium]